MPEHITLYLAKNQTCPAAHRVVLALTETKADYTPYEIDLINKPEWFTPKVNPVGQVPAIAYGGPKVSPDEPSPESAKIAESLVLIEFVADLYPDCPIVPKDPVLRARMRYFIDAVATKYLPAYAGSLLHEQPFEGIWTAFDRIQTLLPADKTYAVSDDFTLADIAILPLLARMEIWLKNDVGRFKEGEGKKAYEYFASSDRFARLRKYYAACRDRESFKTTFDEELIAGEYIAQLTPLRVVA
ncbi:Serine carboxypeptidase [Mycena sanguinolenta]|uniref:Serine carboxypeptidase n=1 Tax=Mycena sanguinolenta TaxID=230812 RepID=A0A8H7D6D0_9AGAR|nr:Serine carboxypeptidase [Mycena sanguinolenta]